MIDAQAHDAGKANQDKAIGLRSCHLAFAIQIAQLLRQIQGGVSGDHQDLANTLKVKLADILSSNQSTSGLANTDLQQICTALN